MGLLDDERLARNYLNGAWSFSRHGYELDVQDPRVGQKIAEVSRSARPDVDEAVGLARAAARDWTRTPLVERCGYLEAAVERLGGLEADLAAMLEVDTGLPADAAAGAVRRLVGGATAALEAATDGPAAARGYRFDRAPVSAHLHGWTAAPAALVDVIADLAAGHAVILHPSDLAPLTAVLFVGALDVLPAGVIALLQGTDSDVSARLASIDGVDRIALRGSRALAGAVMRAASTTVKELSIQIAGARPVVVCEDADPTAAAAAIAEETRHRAAQPYAAAIEVYAQRPVLEPLGSHLAERLAALDPAHEGAQVQPLPSEALERRIAEYLEKLGAPIRVGGTSRGRPRGYWLAPALIDADGLDSPAWPHDLIAPLIFVRSFDELADLPPLAPGPHDGAPLAIWTGASCLTTRPTSSDAAWPASGPFTARHS